jgi:hypothetical protein
MDGEGEPGPPVGGLGAADARLGPAECLLEQPEGVLKIESSKERLSKPTPIELLPEPGQLPERTGHAGIVHFDHRSLWL